MPRRRATFDEDKPSSRRATFDELDPLEPFGVAGHKYAHRKMRTRLDDATIEFMCDRLFRGASLSSIADSLGINSGFLGAWKQYGEAYNDSPEKDRNPHHEIYGRFVLGIRAALGDNRQGLTDQVHDAENRNWFRPFRLLERLEPNVYGMNPRGGTDEDYDADEQFL